MGRIGLALSVPEQNAVDDPADQPVDPHPLDPQGVDRLAGHGAARLTDDLAEVDLVDDLLGEPGDVDPGQDGVQVHPADDSIQVDATSDGVDIDAGGDSVHVHTLDDRVQVDAGGDLVGVDPAHHLVQVDLVEDGGDQRGDQRPGRLDGDGL